MEDILGVLIVLVYLFAAVSGKKKKQKSRKTQQAKRRRTDFAQAFASREADAQDALRRSAPDDAHADECAAERIHLHEVSQEQFSLAGEGEDPCHAGGTPAQEDAFDMEESGEAQRAFAQDVLRGVVMSEILTRPCDRAASRRNRRSAV